MPTPQAYHCLHERHEALRVLALRLLMSDEVPAINGRFASALFDEVGDINLDEVDRDEMNDWDGEGPCPKCQGDGCDPEGGCVHD